MTNIFGVEWCCMAWLQTWNVQESMCVRTLFFPPYIIIIAALFFISIMRTWAQHDGYFIVLLSPRIRILLHKNMSNTCILLEKIERAGAVSVLSTSAAETTASQQTKSVRIFLLKQCEHKHPIHTVY